VVKAKLDYIGEAYVKALASETIRGSLRAQGLGSSNSASIWKDDRYALARLQVPHECAQETHAQLGEESTSSRGFGFQA